MFFETTDYINSRELFVRMLGINYLFATLSLYFQYEGLFGEGGILPIKSYLLEKSKTFPKFADAVLNIPTIFWYNASNTFMKISLLVNIVSSILMICGYTKLLSIITFIVIYNSFSLVGQQFLSYQWDTLLIETSLISLIYTVTDLPNYFSIFMMWFFYFRFIFSAGLVKLIGDSAWRNYSALSYHFWTQPLPNPLSRFFHNLGPKINELFCISAVFIELLSPVLIFTPSYVRVFFVLLQLSLQFMIILTGNYGTFNVLTITLLIPMIPDSYIPFVVGNFPLLDLLVCVLSLCFIYMNSINLLRQFNLTNLFRVPFNNITLTTIGILSKYRLMNIYGLFAHMTKDRIELIIEGSNDGEKWLEYEFYYKPGDISQTPRQVAPHMPRVDWQMWFAALGNFSQNQWIVNMISRFINNDKSVLKFLKKNPFENEKPKFMRIMSYRYKFTNNKDKNHWERELIGEYSPIMEIK